MNKLLILFLLSLMLPITAWGAFFDWGDNFSWSIDVTCGDKTYYNVTGLGINGMIFRPDEDWRYQPDEFDENKKPLVGPFLGICDGFDSREEIIEAYLEWEDEDGTVSKDPLDIIVKDDNTIYFSNNNERTIIRDLESFNIPCIGLHRNCKNTVKIICKESTEPITSVKLNFNPEYNGHPFYEDCQFMFLLPDNFYLEFYDSWTSTILRSCNIPGTFLCKGTYVSIGFHLDWRDMYYYSDWFIIRENVNNNPPDYEFDVSLSNLSGIDEYTPYVLWGTNLQFDLDGGGSVEFTDNNNKTQTVSGVGMKKGFHSNDPNNYSNIKIFPNLGKQLASVILSYENGLDDEKTEVLLNTEYNEELNCYELAEGEGYDLPDGLLEIKLGWMNTITVKFKDEDMEPVTIDFSLTKPTEVNGHALYDDCMMLFDKMNVSVNVCHTVSDGDPSNPQYFTVVDETYTAEVPGTFTQYVDLYNRFIDIDCESGLGDYAVYGFKPVASWDGIIEGADNDVDISYDIPLTNAEGKSNLPWIWGNNLQFDLDGNGEIQFNDETLSGTGIAGKYHDPDPESVSTPIFRIFANPEKALASLKLVYESGLDKKTVETVLNTTFNDELQCYELASGKGYDIVDGRLVLNSGWMNTIVARFKDAEPLELADDDSEKPVGEKNSAVIEANDGVLTDVVLWGRTLYKDNSWNTLCLPFSLTKDEIASSPLSGAEIYSLYWGSVAKSTEHDNTWHIKIRFGYRDSIEAGKPYIIKWTSGDDITDPKFENVTVEDTQNPITVADGHVVFTGYYDAFKATPNDDPMIYYLTDNNELKYTANDRLLKACRAYFTFTPGEGSGKADGFTFDIDFGNGEETGIVTVLSPKGEANGHWYTLDGRRLGGKPTVKGVYINNGQKVVVK